MTEPTRRRPEPRPRRPESGTQTHSKDLAWTLPLLGAKGHPNAESGFSLIEMIIVITLAVAIIVAVAPSFTVSEQTQAAQKLGALAGDIRAAYDTTVLSRKPHRLVFAFASGDYWLERTERDDFYMGDDKADRDPTPDEIKDKKAAFEEEFEQYKLLAGKDIEDSEEEKVVKPTSPLLAAKDKLAPVDWKPVEDSEWEVRHLGPQFVIRSMQAEHHGRLQTLEELGKEGFAYLYFFPQGYVERAVIHIAPSEVDDKSKYDERTYTMTTESYEGVAEVTSGYREVDLTRDEKARP